MTAAQIPYATARPDASAQQHDEQCLQEELRQDRSGSGADSFTDTDFPRTFANRYQHHVHHADSSEEQRDYADCAEEVFHSIGHGAESLLAFDRVPDGDRLFVARIEIVNTAERARDLRSAFFMLLD